MIPFMPSQNPNVTAALAQLGGMAPRSGGADVGGNFAPVFGNAIVGQLVAGLPVTAFAGGEEGINPGAWAQLAEAVRVLTQNGAVSPVTLEQMRGVMLVNIEILRRGVGEAQALQSGSFPVIAPVAPVGVQGAPINEALIPAPAVSAVPQTDDVSGRHRDSVGGAEAMLVAAAAGMPMPAISAGRQDMNVEQAFAALERIVAQAPASELVPLARALRQVINAPASMMNPVMTGKIDAAIVRSGVRNVAVSAPQLAEPVATSAEIVNNPAPALVVAPVVNEVAVSAAPTASVAGQATVPVSQGVETAPVASGVATAPVPGMTVGEISVATLPAAQPAVVTGFDDAAPVNYPVSNAVVVAPAVESDVFVASPVVVSSDDNASAVPMFIPADGATPVETPAFAGVQSEAGGEFESASIPSGQVAPVIAESVDEPVAWLALQANTGNVADDAIVAPSVGRENVAVAPRIFNVAPAIVQGAPVEPRANGATVAVSSGIAENLPAGVPAVSITALEVEPIPSAIIPQPVITRNPITISDSPDMVIPVIFNQATQVADQQIRQTVQVNVATQPAVSVAVEAEPVLVQTSGVAPVIPVGVVATTIVAAVSTPTPVITAETLSVPVEGSETVAASVTNSGQTVEVQTAPRESGKEQATVTPENSEKPGKAAVSARETAVQVGEKAEAPERARSARVGNTDTVSTAADAAINAVRGQAREAVSLPVAVQAVMARVAEAISTAKPGEIRQLDLKLATPELGMVRVKFEVGEEGMVRVVIKTSTEQAAVAIRDGLPQFRNTLENRNVSVQVTQVVVGTAADFGGGNNPHARPEWSNPFQPQASAVNRDEPEFVARVPEGALRRRTLVDILA